jgi:hypothetical protein
VDHIVNKLKAEDAERGARLEKAFHDLTADVRPQYQNIERSKFVANFEKFAIEAQAVFLIM